MTNLDPFRSFVEQPARAAFLVDFDGSLALIVDDPAAAIALPEARDALGRLATLIGRVAVISGRSVEFLAHALDLDHVEYVGLYGMQLLVDGRAIVHPDVEPYLEAVASAATDAERALPGLLVERKRGVSVTLHYRTSPEREGEARTVAAELAARHGLARVPGRLAIELRPPIPVDKGTAVEATLGGADRAAFAGDDRGDLEAFAALDRLVDAGNLYDRVRVAVRSPEAPHEILDRADVVVDGPHGLTALLDALASAISEGRRRA